MLVMLIEMAMTNKLQESVVQMRWGPLAQYFVGRILILLPTPAEKSNNMLEEGGQIQKLKWSTDNNLI